MSCLVLFVSFVSIAATHDSKPNILFILADDLGWGNVGWHNPIKEVKTPNLDELVSEGLELNRHYVHYQCGPTRSSFQSGRLPVYLAEKGIPPTGGIPVNMTTIAHKLKLANYSTHMIGKWHCGMMTPMHTPKARGYDSSLIYFNGAIDYFTHKTIGANNQILKNTTDLWQNNKMNEGPAYNLAGTKYVDFLFHNKVEQLIDTFTPDESWFMVWSPHIVHDPMQIPKQHLFTYKNDLDLCDKLTPYIYPMPYPYHIKDIKFHCRSIHLSMITLLDKLIGSVVQKLKENDLWHNTLLIFSSDNGGSYSFGAAAGNNYPLRGAKHTPFEGGIRAAAFVSGGYLPEQRRGLKTNGMIHISDWYTTFCAMLDIDTFDVNAAQNKPALPVVDGYNIWPLISGTNHSSPRTQLPIDFTALIEGEYKLIISQNKGIIHSDWPGPIFPNSSTVINWMPYPSINCVKGCLFDVVNDMTEHIDLSFSQNKSYLNIIKKMNKTLTKLSNNFYRNSVAMKQKIHCTQSNKKYMDKKIWMIQNRYNGFHGPWCDINNYDHTLTLQQPLIIISDNLLREQLILLCVSCIGIIFIFMLHKRRCRKQFK